MAAAFYIFILKALLALSCGSAWALPEGAARALSERLAAPAPDAESVLNSLLAQLQRNQAAKQRLLRQTDCDEILPEYTESIQGGRERDLGRLVGQVHKHYPICNLKRKIRRLNTNEYEYQPAYYEEVLCVPSGEEEGISNEVCSGLGLSCVQWNKTIHLTRRRYTSDCWETRTLVIPAGCECLWPAHKLGDMSLHI